MRLITEDTVKKIIKAGKAVVNGELRLNSDCLLTPAAKAVVVDYKLKLVLSDKLPADSGNAKVPTAKALTAAAPARNMAGSGGVAACDCSNCSATCECNSAAPACRTVVTPEPAKTRYRLSDGSGLEQKLEHLTQLTGNLLVPKDDPRIYLRGQIDLLIAGILKAQVTLAKSGYAQLLDELDQVYAFIGQLSRSEVLDEPFVVESIIGLSYGQIREISHNPKRYFGRGHLFNISWREGEAAVLLNELRALSRSCELAFYAAFKAADGSVLRGDLMQGFNRLSSILYILCLRAVTGHYGGEQ